MNLRNNFLAKHFLVICFAGVVIFLLGQHLNPNSHAMFTFHDQTQVSRVSQFAVAVQNGQIPPRIAPDFSFHLGYPIFTYYAPASYIITHLLSYFGYSVSGTIQLSFLVGIVVAFLGSYLLLTRYYKNISALVGACIYILTLYVPLTIFVRGNLAEFWLISLLPLGFLAILPSSAASPLMSIMKVVVLILLLSTHNALSLFAGLYLLAYLIFTRATRSQWLILCAGALGSLYFYLPFIFESSQIWAKEVALKTDFKNHFLCIKQLWVGQWGFGGSASGCLEDGMSFKQGKINIGIFIISMLWIVKVKLLDKGKSVLNTNIALFFILSTCVAIFMTTSFSGLIWDKISFLHYMQYPWRFLAFVPLGFAFASGYFVDNVHKMYRVIIACAIIAMLFIYNGKYFTGKNMLKSEYEHTYASRQYIATKAAYLVPEYLPKTVQYDYWRTFEPVGGESKLPIFDQPVVVTDGKYEIIKNSPFQKIVKVAPQEKLTINVHYMPMWNIEVNNKSFIPLPSDLDDLGRPSLPVTEDSIVSIVYKQTQIQFWGLACFLLAVILGGLIPLVSNEKTKRKSGA